VRSAILIAALLVVVAIATHAGEVTPLESVGGFYEVGCTTPDDNDLARVCFTRSDLRNGAFRPACMPATEPGARYEMKIVVPPTPGDDAEVRCYVVDSSGILGPQSDDAGVINFEPPGKATFTPPEKEDSE